MAFKATKDTYGVAYSRDAFGNATALRVSIMAGDEFPPGVEPDPGDGSVEKFDPKPWAGPQYSEGYIEVDKRLQPSEEKDADARERAGVRESRVNAEKQQRAQADAQKLGHGKVAK